MMFTFYIYVLGFVKVEGMISLKEHTRSLSHRKLQRLVEKISLESFGRPFLHRARFNHRLRTTGGRYLLQTHDIEINPKQYEYFGERALIDIIKHELCHYHLHVAGKGYRHRDRDFKELLKKVGAPLHCQSIPEERVIHIYECEKCKHQYRRRRRVNVEKYVCGICRGKLLKR